MRPFRSPPAPSQREPLTLDCPHPPLPKTNRSVGSGHGTRVQRRGGSRAGGPALLRHEGCGRTHRGAVRQRDRGQSGGHRRDRGGESRAAADRHGAPFVLACSPRRYFLDFARNFHPPPASVVPTPLTLVPFDPRPRPSVPTSLELVARSDSLTPPRSHARAYPGFIRERFGRLGRGGSLVAAAGVGSGLRGWGGDADARAQLRGKAATNIRGRHGRQHAGSQHRGAEHGREGEGGQGPEALLHEGLREG